MKSMKVIADMVALCVLVVLSLPAGVYAFPAKDVPVLMYHKVDDEALTTYWVSTDSFREQLFLLHDLGYETVDLEQLYAHVTGVTELPDKPIILTFDDAYQNIYTRALPLFTEHADPNFFGVADIGPTDYIAEDEPNRMSNEWDSDPNGPEPVTPHLIWPEVTALYDAGWGITAHSQTHLSMSDPQYDIAREVNSCDVIASNAGIPTPTFYCYPFGQSSTALVAALEAKGYLGAMDASGGIEDTSRLEADANSLFHIRRTGIMRDDTLAQFAGNIGETLPTIYRLNFSADGDGSIRKNPDRPFYYSGNQVTLTAVPDPFYVFDSWSGDLTGTTNPNSITMDSDKTVTARFVFNGIDLLDDGFEDTVWDANWNDNGVTEWTQDDSYTHTGSYSALAGATSGGYLISDDLDTSDAAAVYVDFWLRIKNTDPGDCTLSYYNGTTYDEIADLGDLGGYNVWLHYTDVITDSTYSIPDFKIRFDAAFTAGENIWVDDVVIKKCTPCIAANLDGIDPVNFTDFAVFAPNWQMTGTGFVGDIDANDVVNLDDLTWIVDHWLNDCKQP
jgi:peptidoglycan/xylan/chitin deacetylase (PgdA/CDA1 family)